MPARRAFPPRRQVAALGPGLLVQVGALVLVANAYGEFAVEYVNKSLEGSWIQSAPSIELGRVLRESRPRCRANVNDRSRLAHSWKRRANKRAGSLQKMIGAMNTASFSKMLHFIVSSGESKRRDSML